jgi:hypothetical protein
MTNVEKAIHILESMNLETNKILKKYGKLPKTGLQLCNRLKKMSKEDYKIYKQIREEAHKKIALL